MTVSRSTPTPDHCREQAGLEVLVTPKEDKKNTPNLENIALKKKNHYSWLPLLEVRREGIWRLSPSPAVKTYTWGQRVGDAFLSNPLPTQSRGWAEGEGGKVLGRNVSPKEVLPPSMTEAGP